MHFKKEPLIYVELNHHFVGRKCTPNKIINFWRTFTVYHTPTYYRFYLNVQCKVTLSCHGKKYDFLPARHALQKTPWFLSLVNQWDFQYKLHFIKEPLIYMRLNHHFVSTKCIPCEIINFQSTFTIYHTPTYYRFLSNAKSLCHVMVKNCLHLQVWHIMCDK